MGMKSTIATDIENIAHDVEKCNAVANAIYI